MVTLGPLPSADFFQLYPDLEWNFEEVLAPVRRFVIESSGPAYTLCHPRFQTYLTEVKLKGQVAKYRAQLLAHCARWAAQQSKYALRFYAQHLAEAQQWEPLYTLAREPTFGPAQLRAFPNNPDLPLETLQLALDGAATTDNAGAMAEFLLAHARKLIDVRQESPLEALRQVSLERACKLADLYEPEQRILWYLLLAWDLHHQGRDDEARALLAKQAEERYPQLGGMFGNAWQGRLAATLLCDLFAVNHIASKSLALLLLNDGGLAELSDRLVAQGDIKAALETAQAIENEWRRDKALSAIATAQAQVGDFPAALQTTQAIEDEWRRDKALSAIAKAQAQAGDTTAALQTTQAIEGEWERTDTLATSLAQAGIYAAATSLAQAGDVYAAATSLAQAGDVYAAFQTAQAIENELIREHALSEIFIDQKNMEIVLAAYVGWNQIKVELSLMYALSAIATRQAQAGDMPEAEATFNFALQTAQKIEGERIRSTALSYVAESQLKAGARAKASASSPDRPGD